VSFNVKRDCVFANIMILDNRHQKT